MQGHALAQTAASAMFGNLRNQGATVQASTLCLRVTRRM